MKNDAGFIRKPFFYSSLKTMQNLDPLRICNLTSKVEEDDRAETQVTWGENEDLIK